jgi:type IX secretion system PorP/SprF family membrane protein
MKRQYAYVLTAISLMSGIKVMAQADISMSTHWNNRATYNPAFIARTDYLYLFSNARHQWVGVKGAPETFSVQASEYFNSLQSAFGLSFVSDAVGVTRAFNPMLTYAYRIVKNQDWALSMGLSGGVFIRTINGSLFEADNILDPSISYNYEKYLRPDVNVGFEYQSAHFIYGISSTHLFSIGKSDSLFLNSNHRYGYVIYRNNNPKLFSYSFGMQVVNRYNLTVLEGSLSFRLKQPAKLLILPLIKGSQEILDFGLTYRSSRQISLLFGVMLSPYLRIGYAYDQSVFANYSRNGTHEIMLEYRIPAKAASTVKRCVDKEFWYR